METEADYEPSFFRTRAARWLTLAVSFAAVLTVVTLAPKSENTAVAQGQPASKKSGSPKVQDAASGEAASQTDEQQTGEKPANPPAKTTIKKAGGKKSAKPVVARKRLSAVDPAEIDKLLPANPLFFMRWDGTASHATAWEATAAYEAFVTSGMSDALDSFLGDLEQYGVEAQIARTVVWHLLERGFSIAANVSIATNPASQKPAPKPSFIAVIHGGAETFEQIRALLPRAKIKESDYSGIKVFHDPASPVETAAPVIWISGPHVLIAASVEDLINSKLATEGKQQNITESGEIWKKLAVAAPGSKKPVAGFAWLQMARAIGLLKSSAADAMRAENPPQSIDPVDVTNRLFELSGAPSLGTFSTQSGFDGRYCWTDSLLELTGKPTGILSALDQKPFTIDEIPPVQPKAAMFIAFSLDLGAVFDATIAQTTGFNTLIEELKRKSEPDAKSSLGEPVPDLAALVKQADAIVGFSIRDDLLASLGHIHCFYPDPDNGALGYGGAFVMQVRDPVRLRKVLQEALKLLPGEETENAVTVNSSEVDGFEIVSLTFPVPLPINPAICITDKWAVIGPNVPTVEAFLDRLADRSPKWTPDEKTVAVLSQMPKEFTCFTYNDPTWTANALYASLPMLQPALAAESRQKEFARPLKLNLPPIDKVRGPLVPSIAVSYRTDAGLRFVSSGTSPTIPAVGSAEASSAFSTSVMVALLLPAVQQAREAARITQSRNNIKQLMLAAHNYHSTHDEFPPGAMPGKGEPETRLSWLVGILPYLDENELYETIDKEQPFDVAKSPKGFFKKIPIFINPSNPMLPPADALQWSHYAGIGGFGEQAPFDKAVTKTSGMFSYNRATRIQDISDGTSNTIAVSEIRERLGPWGQAGPGTVRALTKPPYVNGPDGFGGYHAAGMLVGLADGSVRTISNGVDDKVLEAMSTIAGGEVIDSENAP